MKLTTLCKIKINLQNADFWLIRKGTIERVGQPVRSFYDEHIGIKVVETEILLPDYLFYSFVHLHEQKYFQTIALGSLPLVHIRVSDIKNIRIG